MLHLSTISLTKLFVSKFNSWLFLILLNLLVIVVELIDVCVNDHRHNQITDKVRSKQLEQHKNPVKFYSAELIAWAYFTKLEGIKSFSVVATVEILHHSKVYEEAVQWERETRHRSTSLA